jgi:tetratricopeptide (TPR) repeat protein
VRTLTPVDGETFVATIKPLLERRDLTGVVNAVRSRWEVSQLIPLLNGPMLDARKLALLTLSWVGDNSCILPIVKQLRDPDEVIHNTAEHALYSIFVRSGTCPANHEVCKGTKALDQGKFDEGMFHFTEAIELDPSFAEAYNQRATAHYLMENFEASIDDCDEAIERMPCHFGAWSGKGHALLQLNRLYDAADCYRKAVEIHPHLHCVKETLAEIDFRLKIMGE